MIQTLTNSSSEAPIELVPRVFLYRSKTTNYDAFTADFRTIAGNHPGVRMLLAEIRLSSVLGGWGSATVFDEARNFLNASDGKTYPRLEGDVP